MTTDETGNGASKATQPLTELRDILQAARIAGDADHIHAALIEVMDGLIAHAQKHARALEDLRSDMSHKQGIVTTIGGGDYKPASMPPTWARTEDNDNIDP